LDLALSKGPNWVSVFPPHLRTETDPFPETSCFLVSRISDDGKSPKKPVILTGFILLKRVCFYYSIFLPACLIPQKPVSPFSFAVKLSVVKKKSNMEDCQVSRMCAMFPELLYLALSMRGFIAEPKI
jgi:hypothetical protein